MTFSNLCGKLDKTTLVVCALFVVVIVVLILNQQKSNQNYALVELPEKFAAVADSKKNKLVLYYTNWCGYSKMFLPEWKKFKDAVSGSKVLVLDEVDCEKDKAKCTEVPGYPTVLLYLSNGKTVPFDKTKDGQMYSRNYDGLVRFISDNLKK